MASAGACNCRIIIRGGGGQYMGEVAVTYFSTAINANR